MAGSGGKLTKWLVNKTVVEPTKRKLEAAKGRVSATAPAKKIKAAQDARGKCDVCGGKASSPRHNLCARPECALKMAQEGK